MRALKSVLLPQFGLPTERVDGMREAAAAGAAEYVRRAAPCQAAERESTRHRVRASVLRKRQMIAAQLDLERIAERCGADQRDAGAGEQAHFAQADETRRRILGNSRTTAVAPTAEFGKLHGESAGAHSTSAQLLDQDAHGRAVAQRNPGAVDLANERAAARRPW